MARVYPAYGIKKTSKISKEDVRKENIQRKAWRTVFGEPFTEL
jgi:hypothetical protein